MKQTIIPFMFIIAACSSPQKSIANFDALESILDSCDCGKNLDTLDIKYEAERYLVIDDDIIITDFVREYKRIWDNKADLRRLIARYELAERLDQCDSYLASIEKEAIKIDTIQIQRPKTETPPNCTNSFDDYCRKLSSRSYLDCKDHREQLDNLAYVIESGKYTPYLIDIYLKWRSFAQMAIFGPSTWTYIPNCWYDKVRGVCANTILRHLQENPDDEAAKAYLMELAHIGPLYRFGNPFGNTSMNQ